MKRKTVALYDPYLDVMGGGERHILSIMEVLVNNGYDPVIYWDENLSKSIEDKLHITFKSPIQFRKNIFHSASESMLKRMNEIKACDIFLYVTNGSYFFMPSAKSFIFCMVPKKDLYNMNIMNKIKTANAQFISNSHYTSALLANWGIRSDVMYPYIQNNFLQNFSEQKEKMILVVGRFFNHLHAKRQDLAIEWFTQFQKNNSDIAKYKLVLAGSVKDEDQEYFKSLQKNAETNNSIEFKPNISFDELLTLYKDADIYWHLAGFGVNTQEHPENVEHLGITPLEAMASGCLVFAYNAGGLKELIQDGKNGYLFSSQEELFSKIGIALYDEINNQIIRKQAAEFVKDMFSYEIFENKVKEVMLKP